MREFSPDQFAERAAIREFDAGMSRFDAETAAAQEQGMARWQALQLVKEHEDANGCGPAGADGHQPHTMGGRRDADDLPRVQPEPQEEARPVSVGQPEAGRDRGVLLALQLDERGAL